MFMQELKALQKKWDKDSTKIEPEVSNNSWWVSKVLTPQGGTVFSLPRKEHILSIF